MARSLSQRARAASELARWWDGLPAARQESLRRELREGLAGLKSAAEGAETPAPRPPKHIRYQHGEMRVLASARRTPPPSPQQAARISRAWDKLSAGVQKGQR
jgi:hypothetical protein